jgi:two-component system, chemotaxis family, sensor kinase CheA
VYHENAQGASVIHCQDYLQCALALVVAQNGETTIGLLVDHLIGMQEIVLKSLEKNFRPVPSLSGASILGDGRVSLILDIDALIGMVTRDHSRLVG